VRFLFDNCLAPKHAKAFNSLFEPEHQAVALRDRFEPNTPDDVWLPKLAEEGDWIVISGDVRIGRSSHEQKVWHDSKLTVFFLKKGWTNLPLLVQHAKLASCMEEIIKLAERAKRGSGFVVSVNGKIDQIYAP
jgi:hypothetical protein